MPMPAEMPCTRAIPTRNLPDKNEPELPLKDMLRSRLEGLRDKVRALPKGATAAGAYSRTVLHESASEEAAGMRWAAGRSSPLHGHDGATVLIQVLSGALLEERYLPDGAGGYRCEVETLRAGSSTYLPSGSFHRVWCLDEADTIHAFSPRPENPIKPVPDQLIPDLERARRALVDALAELSASLHEAAR